MTTNLLKKGVRARLPSTRVVEVLGMNKDQVALGYVGEHDERRCSGEVALNVSRKWFQRWARAI